MNNQTIRKFICSRCIGEPTLSYKIREEGNIGACGPCDQDGTKFPLHFRFLSHTAGSTAAGGADARTLEVAVDAREVHQKREGARGAGVALICEQRYAWTAFTIRQTSWRSLTRQVARAPSMAMFLCRLPRKDRSAVRSCRGPRACKEQPSAGELLSLPRSGFITPGCTAAETSAASRGAD